MNAAKTKVSELTGAALDWAIAKAEGDELAALNIQYPEHSKYFHSLSPSSDWALAGPIIERIGISVALRYGSTFDGGVNVWDATVKPEFWSTGRRGSGVKTETIQTGPTPLVAAMRCYVVSKLGDEIEIPEELT